MFACTTEASDDTGDDNGGAAGTGGTGGTSGGGSDCGVGGNGSTLMCPDGAKACTQLVIPEQQCSFTQSEALAGIDIAYQVVTTEAVENVFPEPLDQGGCGTPDDSGLIVFEELDSSTGGTDHYCLCDTGLCAPTEPAAVTVPAGTFEKTFTWGGRNFNGPSDTGQEPGDAFPPGLYVLRLSATGQQELDGTRQAFDVGAAMTIRITAD